MIILALETSCDDTSIAILRDAELLSLQTRSQMEHNETRGVVPEVAARLHEQYVFDVLDVALEEAGVTLSDIDMIACTESPGLMPSLMVGKTVAKTLARLQDIPVYFMNHIEGHLFSVFLDRARDEIQFPAICLSVSGGHNELFIWRSLHEYECI